MSIGTKLVNFNKQQLRTDLPKIEAGMKIRVHERIKEGDKERVQVFEGIVLAVKHGRGASATITVRNVVAGVGVEKIWPLHSPKIVKIEVLRASKVRRAKLYFLRALSPKKIRRKLSIFKDIVADEPEPAIDEAEEEKVAEEETENEQSVAAGKEAEKGSEEDVEEETDSEKEIKNDDEVKEEESKKEEKNGESNSGSDENKPIEIETENK